MKQLKKLIHSLNLIYYEYDKDKNLFIFDENYNNRLSSFRQDMHNRFIEGVRNNIPVAKLLDSTSDNYIAKDILDYTPTKSQVRDALLSTAKKKEPILVSPFFKRKQNSLRTSSSC